MKHKIESPYRSVYKNMEPPEKQAFINFLKKTRHIFRNIDKASGDICYVLGILPFISDDERMYPYRKKGASMPEPWQHLEAVLSCETSFRIKKYDPVKDSFVEIKSKDTPQNLYLKLKEMEKHLSIKTNPFAGGKLTATYDMEVSYNNERYILTYTQTPFLKDTDIKSRRRGRIGETSSNLAMHLLYKHFKQIKLKHIYKQIASLVNEYSITIFRPVTGSPLSPENVRKRVQWTKKKKAINEYVRDYESIQPIRGVDN